MCIRDRSWGWAGLFLVFFVVVDFAFFSANIIKVFDGGWFPLVLGVSVFVLLSTWRLGRRLLSERQKAQAIPLDAFIAGLAEGGPQRVDGTGGFLTAHPGGVPRALLPNLNPVSYTQLDVYKRQVLPFRCSPP